MSPQNESARAPKNLMLIAPSDITDFFQSKHVGYDYKSPFYRFLDQGKYPDPAMPLPNVYTETVQQIGECLLSGNSVVLAGRKNTGKTSILRGIGQFLGQSQNIRPVFVYGLHYLNYSGQNAEQQLFGPFGFGIHEAIQEHINLEQIAQGKIPDVQFVYRFFEAQTNQTQLAGYQLQQQYESEIKRIRKEIMDSGLPALEWLAQQHPTVRFVYTIDELDHNVINDRRRDLDMQESASQLVMKRIGSLAQLPNVTMLIAAHRYKGSDDDQNEAFPGYTRVVLDGTVTEDEMRTVIAYGLSMTGKNITVTDEFCTRLAALTGRKLYDINMCMNSILKIMKDRGDTPKVFDEQIVDNVESLSPEWYFLGSEQATYIHNRTTWSAIESMPTSAYRLIIQLLYEKQQKDHISLEEIDEGLSWLIDEGLVLANGNEVFLKETIYTRSIISQIAANFQELMKEHIPKKVHKTLCLLHHAQIPISTDSIDAETKEILLTWNLAREKDGFLVALPPPKQLKKEFEKMLYDQKENMIVEAMILLHPRKPIREEFIKLVVGEKLNSKSTNDETEAMFETLISLGVVELKNGCYVFRANNPYAQEVKEAVFDFANDRNFFEN